MTPPTAKPEPGATDGSANTDADEAGTLNSPGEEGGGNAPGPRRRAAALGVRAARRRAAGEAEGDAEDTNAGPGRGAGRAARAAVAGRTGPRAQQRAARAALADEGGDVPGPDDGTDATNTGLEADTDPEAELVDDLPDVAVAPPAYLQARNDTPPPAPIAPAAPAAPAPADDMADDGDDDDRGPLTGGRRRGARAEKRAGRVGNRTDASNYVVAPTVNPAQMRVRHYGVIAMFVLFVVVPTLCYSAYLWTRSADQYQSDVGFGSRTEEVASAFDFLGALGGSSSSGSKDMDILNQFIISQELVSKVDAQLNLKAIYAKPTDDPLNAFNPDGTIEDLVAFWQRMVLVNYDNATGLMNLEVYAFDPIDAQRIAQVILTESTDIINTLSQTAQEDTTRYSAEALAATEEKLAAARLAVLDFQIRNRIVDPNNVINNQLTVVSTLNQQLAASQIELDMLAGTVKDSDPRVLQLTRRIGVIQNRIAEEQSKVGATSDSTSPGFAKLMADFESLKVDQDFAQQAYSSARAAYEQALTDAQQKTRYLATYVAPTLAEAPTAPNRPFTAALVALIGFLSWAVVVLVYYALRDRR